LDALRNESTVVPDAQLAPIKFYPRFSNLTNVTFSEEETRYLEKGLNFSAPPVANTRTFDNFIADLTVGLGDNVAAVTQCAKAIEPFLSANLHLPTKPSSCFQINKAEN